MYRTIYPAEEASNHSWQKKESMNGKRALEKCECIIMRLQYRHHWGWFKKMFGFFILFLSIALLIWNEKRAVDNSRSYHDGMRAVTLIQNSEEVLPHNEGRLVHVSGYLRIFDPLEDPTYGVAIYAVKLKRRVQMYQWVEESTPLEASSKSGFSSFHYSKEWKDKLIDSDGFRVTKDHENPKYLPVQSEIRINPFVYLGSYKLGPEFKERFNSFIQFTSGERPEVAEIKMHMGLYYHSSDIWNPSVGDLRIQFSFAGPTNAYVSIVALQRENELRPFTTETGAIIGFLHEGKKQHVEIFNKEHSTIAFQSWIYRAIAYLVAVFGTFLASKIIALMNRRNPVVKNLMAMGPQKFSIVTAGFLCLSVMGCIWFNHKPIFGFLLVTFSCALVLYYAFTGPDIPKVSKVSLPQYSPRVY